jgi:hypothetical protein
MMAVIPKSKKLTLLVWASLGLAIVAGATLCVKLPSIMLKQKYKPQIAFEQVVWQNNTQPRKGLSLRQMMVMDVVDHILPQRNQREIEELLGVSSTHLEMRRHRSEDFQVREHDASGAWKPYPRTGNGYYFDEFGWDLIYELGQEQMVIYDHNGQAFSPDTEYLMIRLDQDGRFESWFIYGSTCWTNIVSSNALCYYRPIRKGVSQW